MKKRITGILFSFALLLAMMPVLGISQTAYADEHTVEYLDENGNPSSHVVNGFITDETTSLSAGWYAVESDGLELSGLAIRGDVRIILCDGASLTVEADSGDGITVNGSLTIYAQSEGDNMGKLSAEGANGISVAGGNLKIVGGDVTATATENASYGINGGGSVTIMGGKVKATGNGGCGLLGSDGVLIKAGSVTAGDGVFGIASTGIIKIEGGSVEAAAKKDGGFGGIASIGDDAGIEISGGTVKATGGTNGIVSGVFSPGKITISGGTVEANGSGYAIFASSGVEVTGGIVTAEGGGYGIDVGTGGVVTIGDNVFVMAGEDEGSATDVTGTFEQNHKYKWVHTDRCTLWVGGIPVTSRNAADILGTRDTGVTASYDYSTETLTLNNYSYESEGYNFDTEHHHYAAIYANQALTILLEGDNTVKCTEKESSVGNGIFVTGKGNDLIIGGSGTLTASGYGNGGHGIYTWDGDITINGGTVTSSSSSGNGITTDKYGGSVVINSGIVTASGNSSFSATQVEVTDDMGINAGDSKEIAVDVDKEYFKTIHTQKWAQISKAYPLWVRGTRVMVANRDDVLSDGIVSFAPATDDTAATLTLKGNVTADPEKQYSNAAIYYGDKEHDLTIDAAEASVVKGPNHNKQEANKSCGIQSEGPLTVKGKLEAAGRTATFSFGIFAAEMVVDADAEVKASGGDACIDVSEGKVDVKGKLTVDGDKTGLFIDGGSDGEITVNDGAELTATGREVAGIASNNGKGVIRIEKGAKVSAVGGSEGAIDGIVKNAVPGLGWTNMEGTKGKTFFDIDTRGRELGTDIKCAVFPAPAASVTKAPEAKNLTYSGSAQELVTAGKAKDGTMQYALGKDGTTPPEKGWSTSVPKGTEAGDYYVWYKAAGDDTHGDSGPACVKVTIAKKSDPAPAEKPVAAVRGIAKGKTALKLKWNKVSGAAKYEVWMSRCDTDKKTYSVKKVKTLGASKTTWTKKKLKKNTAYKFRVVAKDASGRVISKSLIGHAVTGNVCGKYTNAKSLKVKKSSFTLKKGGTAKIKATQTGVRKGKKLLDGGHAALLRYRSSDPSVAAVNSKGKITAKGTGNCLIYVQTVNGIWKTVKVSVN